MTSIYTKIGELSEYHELLRRRRTVAVPLTVLMLVAYYAFILLVAYAPSVLSIRLADGVTSLGVLLGLGIIGVTLAITAFYVWYTNKHLEDLVSRIQEKVMSNG